ncbi:hypothetical protein Tco_0892211 [Tanacetum coccineum]|uniref:Retrotransposon gag domain-containing protein n=1 Tax=Tanacetum coccineum TaxID=301880 RepID=A0ABQ5CAM8_9ASTR
MKITNGEFPEPNINSTVRALLERRIISWILNTVVGHIGNNLNFIHSASKLWLELEELYAQIDSHRIYQLSNDIVQLKQTECTIKVYYQKMKGLWGYNQNNFIGNRSNYSQGESSERRNYSQGESSERMSSFKKGVICGICGNYEKEGHAKEQCYKLVGYPVGHPLHGNYQPPKPYRQTKEYKPNRTMNMATTQ